MDSMMIERGTLMNDQLLPDVLFGARFDLPTGYQYNASSVCGGYEDLGLQAGTIGQMAGVLPDNTSVDFDMMYGGLHIARALSAGAVGGQTAFEAECSQSMQQATTEYSRLDLLHQRRFHHGAIDTQPNVYGKDCNVHIQDHQSFQSELASDAENSHYWPMNALERSIMVSTQGFCKGSEEAPAVAMGAQSGLRLGRGGVIAQAAECDEGAFRMFAPPASKYGAATIAVPLSPVTQDRREQPSADIDVGGAFNKRLSYGYPFNEESGLGGVTYVYNQDTISDNGGIQNIGIMSEISPLETVPYNAYIAPAASSEFNMCENTAEATPQDLASRKKYQSTAPQPLAESPRFLSPSSARSHCSSPATESALMDKQKHPGTPPFEGGDADKCPEGTACPAPAKTARSTVGNRAAMRSACLQLRQRRKSATYSRLSSAKSSGRSSYKSKMHHSHQSSKISLEFTKSQSGDTLTCPHPGCSKIFPKLYNLKSHMVCHSGDRPHTCSLCKKAFARKHDLQRHLRTIHSEHRPFSCDLCLESFPRADALRRHKIVERGTLHGLDKKSHNSTCGSKRISAAIQAQQQHCLTQVQAH